MKIPFHDLQSQYQAYKDEINIAIQKVLDSCQFIMGPEVSDFEQALANFIGCKNVVSCGSGTDALLLALISIDLKAGEEVITSPFTFIATAEAISLLHAKPIFADITMDTYHIDPVRIEEKITPKTRAIIPVSLYGQPADMDEINELAEFYGNKFGRKIYVIEDAAQSLGAEYKGNKSANLSDIGCVSFFPTKPLGCYGDGGAVIVNDDILAEKIRHLRVHGQTKRYQHKYIGFNCRLDTLQAAILQVKLKYLADELQSRKKIADYYNKSFLETELSISMIKKDRTSAYAQYSLKVSQRNYFIEYLTAKEIPTAIHYPMPLHLQECFTNLGHVQGDFPNAEQCATEILSLPMSAFLTDIQQKYIVNAVCEAVDNSKFIKAI